MMSFLLDVSHIMILYSYQTFQLLPTSDIDEYGFKRSENFDYKSYELFMSTYLKTLSKRRMKWEVLLRQQNDLTNITSKLKRYIRKGIPGNFKH